MIEFNSDYDILVVSKKRLGKSEGNVETRIRERFAEGQRRNMKLPRCSLLAKASPN